MAFVISALVGCGGALLAYRLCRAAQFSSTELALASVSCGAGVFTFLYGSIQVIEGLHLLWMLFFLTLTVAAVWYAFARQWHAVWWGIAGMAAAILAPHAVIASAVVILILVFVACKSQNRELRILISGLIAMYVIMWAIVGAYHAATAPVTSRSRTVTPQHNSSVVPASPKAEDKQETPGPTSPSTSASHCQLDNPCLGSDFPLVRNSPQGFPADNWAPRTDSWNALRRTLGNFDWYRNCLQDHNIAWADVQVMADLDADFDVNPRFDRRMVIANTNLTDGEILKRLEEDGKNKGEVSQAVRNLTGRILRYHGSVIEAENLNDDVCRDAANPYPQIRIILTQATAPITSTTNLVALLRRGGITVDSHAPIRLTPATHPFTS